MRHSLRAAFLFSLAALSCAKVPLHHPTLIAKPINETLSQIVPLTPITQVLHYDYDREVGLGNGGTFRIAFGSCYGLVNFYTDIFRHVNAFKPDLWVWLGDAAYTDDIMGSCKSHYPLRQRFDHCFVDKPDNTMPPEYVRKQY